MNDEIIALAAKVEAAPEGSRSLDGKVWLVLDLDFADGFTSSLDAALRLLPKGAFWRLGHDGEGPDPSQFKAEILVTRPGSQARHTTATAATSALALCSAALRAIGDRS